jgi:two-component system chemotaxis response regulator CheY
MKVLIIDDDPRFRALLKRLLEKKFDAVVEEAENGLVGIDMVKKGNPHIIFLDYEMPHMNGKQFLQKLREFNKIVPVAVMTAHSEKELVSDIIPHGITDYIIKADMAAGLAERIGQIFSKNLHLISRKL